MSAPRLLIIQHEDDCPPEWFGEWFRQAGLAFDVIMGHRGDLVPDTLTGYDGLVVLGGEMGAYDDKRHPWLTPTKQLIATVVEAGQCFLGICLGHQLATVALGGQVIVNPAGQAKGLTEVVLTDAGRADSVIQSIRDGAQSIQWNSDIAASLPAGTVALATAPDGTVQAARFGARAWGVQFHPETSPRVFASWGHGATDAVREANTTALRQIEAAESALRADWEPVARRFAEVVRQAAADSQLAAS
ncbi:MAG: type 1 glutamine amidotransferase [Nocardioidaceae bacterium]|nr:type 1 glutamine amidotransferase [Nocardioidaceae bacterium]